MNALYQIAVEVEAGHVSSRDISIDLIDKKLAFCRFPSPDLLIRTSGEQRISNFMLWQLGRTELYFTPVFWPDFNADELDKALAFFCGISAVRQALAFRKSFVIVLVMKDE